MKNAIGILYAFNGLSMLIIWPILIITNQAPEIHTNPVYMGFHLVSESIVAIACFITGVGFLFKKGWATKLYYPASGLFIGAGYLAIGYYLFSNLETALPVLFMLIGLNIAGLIFFYIDLYRCIIASTPYKIKLMQFFNGISIYTLINIGGFLAEMKSVYNYVYLSMIIILIVYSAWNISAYFKKY